mmetsp:Transcript_1713/g.4264  ORF Transcript_1713/g.4264 Transcript_1713/m.4264 type:complete len:128 (-) Transcript_1713:58-441(-)
MAFDKIKGLSPAMQGKYWGEAVQKEQREHLHHSLNVPTASRRSMSAPQHNPKEFYANTWRTLERRYDQAAGMPSPLVDMARRYTGSANTVVAVGMLGTSRPATGTSSVSRRSVSSSRAHSVASGSRH